MGLIKTAINTIQGGLADQWLEVIEPQSMSDTTVMTCGVKVRVQDARNNNVKGTVSTVSNGSIIHVYPNQFMMLLDNGKIVDYTAEAGTYQVSNTSIPSLFSGKFGDALKETFDRFKFGGVTPGVQKVFYINLQEIKGIKFGTHHPVNYYDNFYNAELFLRAHGTYSIKIVEPLKFFMEAIPRNKEQVDINDINEQYLSEFLNALQSTMNQMSADGIRISHVASKGVELAQYMANTLDANWTEIRGMQVQSVGISGISYDDESKKLINMRNEGAMLQDPTIREGYVQGSVARGLEAAGSNANGSMAGFMGMGVGMQGGSGFMGAASAANQSQMHQQQQVKAQPTQTQPVAQNTAVPAREEWKCSCGVINTGKFCAECGLKRPEKVKVYCCNKCGFEPSDPDHLPKFCPECGDVFNEEDVK